MVNALRAYKTSTFTLNNSTGSSYGHIKITEVEHLTDLLESFAQDGTQCQIKNISFHCQLRTKDSIDVHYHPIGISFGVVQTNGTITITDRTSAAVEQLNNLLDLAVDEDFGYQRITQTKITKPIYNVGADQYLYGLDMNFNIPQNLIAQLNKNQNVASNIREPEGLRLVVIQSTPNEGENPYTLYLWCEIDFNIRLKSIKIR